MDPTEASENDGPFESDDEDLLDEEDDAEEIPKEEPPGWQAPVQCPKCEGPEVRLVTYHYEAAVYECQGCGVEFETGD